MIVTCSQPPRVKVQADPCRFAHDTVWSLLTSSCPRLHPHSDILLLLLPSDPAAPTASTTRHCCHVSPKQLAFLMPEEGEDRFWAFLERVTALLLTHLWEAVLLLHYWQHKPFPLQLPTMPGLMLQELRSPTLLNSLLSFYNQCYYFNFFFGQRKRASIKVMLKIKLLKITKKV